MRRGWEGLAIAAAMTACAPARPPPGSSIEIREDYRDRIEKEIATGEREIVWPDCDEHHDRQKACGLLATDFFGKKGLRGVLFVLCGEQVEDKISDRCVRVVTADFVGRLGRRYSATSREAVDAACGQSPTDCDGAAGLELVWLTQHNSSVLTRTRKRVDALVSERDSAEAAADRQRQASEAEDVRRRDFFRVIAAGLAGASVARTGSATSPASSGCTDDAQCAIDAICLRAAGAARGTCSALVNRYGAPSTDSGAKLRHSTSYGTQCPALCPGGSHCEYTDHGGICVR